MYVNQYLPMHACSLSTPTHTHTQHTHAHIHIQFFDSNQDGRVSLEDMTRALSIHLSEANGTPPNMNIGKQLSETSNYIHLFILSFQMNSRAFCLHTLNTLCCSTSIRTLEWAALKRSLQSIPMVYTLGMEYVCQNRSKLFLHSSRTMLPQLYHHKINMV